MSFLSTFYRSAKSVAIDAIANGVRAEGAEVHNIEERADFAVRIGALGMVSSASAIGLIAAKTAASILVVTNLALAASTIAGLIMIRRSARPQLAFLATSAVWIAGAGFVASESPLFAVGAMCALALATVKANFFSTAVIEDAAPAIEAVPEISVFEAVKPLFANFYGEVEGDGSIDDVPFATHEKLTDRIHLTDRVAFLRLLSQLRNGEKDQDTIVLKLDRSATGGTQRFETQTLRISRRADMVAITPVEVTQPATEVVTEQPTAKADSSQFLTIVSHELRTPLNAIIGFSDLLRGGMGHSLSEDKRDEYVELIHGAGTHLLSLVNTILDVSKIESGAYEIHRDDFHFTDTARDCIAMLGSQSQQKSVQINDRISRDLAQVNGDRRAIKQILINLLSNAVKYTEKGGFVTVDASSDALGLSFEVSDTGIGMTPDEIEKIGQPFAQMDNSTTRNCEGTGLGLALVNGLVELHGGTIQITSKHGVGTRVLVFIPAQVTAVEDQSVTRNVKMDQLQELLPLVNLKNSTPDDRGISHGTRKAG